MKKEITTFFASDNSNKYSVKEQIFCYNEAIKTTMWIRRKQEHGLCG